MQQMERFDIRDAVDALVVMLNSNPTDWKPVYNLSSGEVLSLRGIAEKTITIAKEKFKNITGEIIVEPKEVCMNFGMDSSLFYNDFSWKPTRSIDDTIESLFDYYCHEAKKIQ